MREQVCWACWPIEKWLGSSPTTYREEGQFSRVKKRSWDERLFSRVPEKESRDYIF